MCEAEVQPAVLEYIRGTFLPAVSAGTHTPQLTQVIDVPGAPEFEHEARSMALQLSHDSRAEQLKWYDDTVVKALGYVHEVFGEKCLCFVTVLEQLPL